VDRVGTSLYCFLNRITFCLGRILIFYISFFYRWIRWIWFSFYLVFLCNRFDIFDNIESIFFRVFTWIRSSNPLLLRGRRLHTLCIVLSVSDWYVQNVSFIVILNYDYFIQYRYRSKLIRILFIFNSIYLWLDRLVTLEYNSNNLRMYGRNR
jgi:hypothetical protein